MSEHRETLEEFLKNLDFGEPKTPESKPDSASQPKGQLSPLEQALERAKSIEAALEFGIPGGETLAPEEENWLKHLAEEAQKFQPQVVDLPALIILIRRLSNLDLPRTLEIQRAISIGMAYQAELNKHHESTNDGATTKEE